MDREEACGRGEGAPTQGCRGPDHWPQRLPAFPLPSSDEENESRITKALHIGEGETSPIPSSPGSSPAVLRNAHDLFPWPLRGACMRKVV